jgi:hypothetical protein
VLDQIPLARAVCAYIGQGLPHYAELMVARPYLFAFLLAGARVPLFDDLGLVLQDVGQSRGNRVSAIRLGCPSSRSSRRAHVPPTSRASAFVCLALVSRSFPTDKTGNTAGVLYRH